MEGRHTTDWVWWKQVCPGLLAGKPECSLCAYRPGVDIAGRRKNWQEMYVKAFFGAQDWPLLGRTREVSEKGQRTEKHCHGACGVGERVGGKQLLQCELLWFGGDCHHSIKMENFLNVVALTSNYDSFPCRPRTLPVWCFLLPKLKPCHPFPSLP